MILTDVLNEIRSHSKFLKINRGFKLVPVRARICVMHAKNYVSNLHIYTQPFYGSLDLQIYVARHFLGLMLLAMLGHYSCGGKKDI